MSSRFIVFDDADRLLLRPAMRGRLRMGSRNNPKAPAGREGARLLYVGAIAQIEDEGFESTRIHATLEQRVIRGQEHAAAVDAAGEADADRSVRGNRVEPLANLVGERADVLLPDYIQIGRQGPHLRREESRVNRIGIRAAYELNFDDVMGGDHARGKLGWKLRVEAFFAEPLIN